MPTPGPFELSLGPARGRAEYGRELAGFVHRSLTTQMCLDRETYPNDAEAITHLAELYLEYAQQPQ